MAFTRERKWAVWGADVRKVVQHTPSQSAPRPPAPQQGGRCPHLHLHNAVSSQHSMVSASNVATSLSRCSLGEDGSRIVFWMSSCGSKSVLISLFGFHESDSLLKLHQPSSPPPSARNGHKGFSLSSECPQQPALASPGLQAATPSPSAVTEHSQQSQPSTVSSHDNEFSASVPLFVEKGGYDSADVKAADDREIGGREGGPSVESGVPCEVAFVGCVTDIAVQTESATGMRVSIGSPSEMNLRCESDASSEEEETTLSDGENVDNSEWEQSYTGGEESDRGNEFEEEVEVDVFNADTDTDSTQSDEVEPIIPVEQTFTHWQPRSSEAGSRGASLHRRAALLYPEGASTNLFGSMRVEGHGLPSLDGWLRQEGPAARLSVDEHNESGAHQASRPGNLVTLARRGSEFSSQIETLEGSGGCGSPKQVFVPRAFPSRLEEDGEKSSWIYKLEDR